MDTITQFFRESLRLFGSKYKIYIGIGILIGIVLSGVREVIVIETKYVALNAFGDTPTLALGILLAFLPLLWQQHTIPASYRRIFKTIDYISRETNLTKKQRKEIYEEILVRIIAGFTLNEELTANKIEEEVTKKMEKQ